MITFDDAGKLIIYIYIYIYMVRRYCHCNGYVSLRITKMLVTNLMLISTNIIFY
jgi:hypothetical protein